MSSVGEQRRWHDVFGRLRREWPWVLFGLAALTCAGAITAILASGPDHGTAPSSLGDFSRPSHSAPESRQPKTAGTTIDAWTHVARGFGQTFTRTSLGQDAWFTAMSSWLTDDQAAMYSDVPISDVPSGTLSDVAVADPGVGDTTSGVLTYDTGLKLEVGLVHIEAAGGWLVASVRLSSAP